MLPAAVAVVFALLLWKLRRIPKDGRRGSGLPLDANSVEESLSVNISRERERSYRVSREYKDRKGVVRGWVRVRGRESRS